MVRQLLIYVNNTKEKFLCILFILFIVSCSNNSDALGIEAQSEENIPLRNFEFIVNWNMVSGDYSFFNEPRANQIAGMCFLTTYRNFVEFVGRGNYSEGDIIMRYLSYSGASSDVVQDLIQGASYASIDNFMRAMSYVGYTSYSGIVYDCQISMVSCVMNNRATIGIVQGGSTMGHALLVLGTKFPFNEFLVFDPLTALTVYPIGDFISVVLVG